MRLLREAYASENAGIVYYPACESKNIEYLSALCLNGYPIVTIDKYYEGVPLDYVVSDNFNGSYTLTSRLIQLEHRQIAYMSFNRIASATTIKSRYLGYCKALRDNGIFVNSDLVLCGYGETIKTIDIELYASLCRGYVLVTPKQSQPFIKMVSALLERGATAIQTTNDNEAIVLVRVCGEMGVKVPEQLSIAGFDNIEISEHISVPLTTVSQNFFEVGKRAAEILVGAIKKDTYRNTSLVIPVALVERDSTARAPRN